MGQGHFTDRHNLILTVIQFVHLAFLLGEILNGSQQFTLLSAVLLALRKLFVARVIGFPLPLLGRFNFAVCHGFLLFDCFPLEPMLYALPFHLPLMIIEDAIERIRAFFRLLTAFPVELARVVHALAGSNRPPLHILQSPLERFSLFRHFGVGDDGFSIAVIGINGLITNDKFCLSRTAHLHLGYCRLPEHTKQALTATSGYPSHKDSASCQGGSHETPPVEDHTSARRTSGCPTPLGSGLPSADELDAYTNVVTRSRGSSSTTGGAK